MSIRIKIAETPGEVAGLFRARHQVFAVEEGKFPVRPDGMMFDCYDSYPTTANIVAVMDGRVVGGIRMAEWSSEGMPADHYFDFKPWLPKGETSIVHAGLFCLIKQFRSNPLLGYMIMNMASYWAISRQIKYIVAPINPAIALLLKKAGFTAVSDRVWLEHDKLYIEPMLLETAKLKDSFLNFAKRQKLDRYLEFFEREFFSAGECIIRRGEVGAEAAYVVVSGTARVTVETKVRGRTQERTVAEIGRGDLIGELSLLTHRPRTANVYATTDVDMMVLERGRFEQQVFSSPERMREFINILGFRLADTLDLLSQPAKEEA